MPLRLSTKKSAPLAAQPEAMSSEVTLVGQSMIMSEKEAAAAGPSKKKTRMTWKEAQEASRKDRNWEVAAQVFSLR